MMFSGYLYFILKRKEEFIEEIETISSKKATLFLILGAIGLFLGGELVVKGAVEIASTLGLSTMFIGTSIIAIGTALPELVTIIISVLKNKQDLAIGNIVGSNIFNVLLVLGVSATIRPIPFETIARTNFLLVALSTIIVMLFLFLQQKTQKKYSLTKWHGIILLGLYLVYLTYFFNI